MDNNMLFREAEETDVDEVVKMLANDPLGKTRENYIHPLPDQYLKAFEAIRSDPNNELIVAVWENQIIGVLQITFTPYITHQGGWRATIEGVRTSEYVRGKGVGTNMITWAIERAKTRNCHLVQLTTDKTRKDALRFYEKLGFQATHEGLKLKL
ncbi:Ribosomal protein S18 acetylase RimI [Gracilibacillus orientalis]|uniref:Ribosomal protein S18 acetylase RimI n=2 Tax=Gracilibacillus orientalis TaxID=334253 RepID=A0A1I4MUG3_9BACI|nr:GNAT family N-acetyltransferase [Gracilibacillus orientalis]SFM06942.1 Ribosomal protein S18 acetylase RimI [Gracilibacillus orientalis]